MYTALYRTFRPEVFEDIIGQEHIVKILKNQLAQGTTSHAYLFCGTRGTGKTSTARILAKGLNCISRENRPCGECENCLSIQEGVFLDVVEIDAASNNGVDNIRELRESVKYPPAVGRTKVYIIDEVHMLSSGAFNALLKTLEEPPENVVFILATTEPQKLPATILSRCLRLDFRRVSEAVLKKSMREICEKLEVKISPAALGIIAANADGSVRDGLSILDQCIAGGGESVTREEVLEILGTSGEDVFVEMTEFVGNKDIAGALLLLDKVLSDGKDVRQFIRDWIAHYRGLLMIKFIKNPEDMLSMSWENIERIREQSDKIDLYVINDSIIELSKTASEAKWSTQPRILLELCIVKLAGAYSGGATEASDGGNRARQIVNTEYAKPQRVSETSLSRQKSGEGTAKEATDNGDIWYRLFSEAEHEKPSFNLIRTGARLVGIKESTFTVEANNDLIAMYLNENKSEIEKIMDKITGKHLQMEVTLKDEKPEKKDLATKIGNKLGLNIEFE